MKKEITSRGLFFDWSLLDGIERKWTSAAELKIEQSEIINIDVRPDDQASGLKEWADNILRGNGIDPDGLWNMARVEMVDAGTGLKVQVIFVNWAVPQPKSFSPQILEAMDRIPGYEPLSPEPHGVLDVMVQWYALHCDVDSGATRAALSDAMRLTAAIEQLKGNRVAREALEKKRQRSYVARNKEAIQRAKKEKIAKTEWQPRLAELHRTNPWMSWTRLCWKLGNELEPRISGRKISRYCKKSF